MIYKSRFKSFHVIYDFDLNKFSGHDLWFWLKSFLMILI